MDRHQQLRYVRELGKRSRDVFAKAHEQGLAALDRHDYEALARAIADEASAIATHEDAVKRLDQAIKSDK
jgi:hypothetical protein